MNQHGGKGARAWLSAAEAADLLDVKRTTLYAYVSRGHIRSRSVTGTRGRLYHREDVERLRARGAARSGHGPVAAAALRWGEPVLDSAITEIRADGPAYREQSSVALAREGRSYESVAELLWTGSLPERSPTWTAQGPALPVRKLAACLPAGATPLDAMAMALPVLAVTDARRYARGDTAVLDSARAALLQSAACVALPSGPDRVHKALAETTMARRTLVALGARPTRAAVAAVEAALILCADHELNVSAFAARVAGSTEADLYACFSAALGTFTGPKHGGASGRIEALLDEIADAPRPGRAVAERFRRGARVPGFGHPLYPAGDPRAPLLLELASDLGGAKPLASMHTLLDAMELLAGQPPNLDAGLVALSRALRLPTGSAAVLFAVGRMAGWAAHALEQRKQGHLLRPRARYTGAIDHVVS